MTKDFLRIWIEKMEGLEDFVPDATVDSQNRPYGAYDHHEISTSVGLVTQYWIACDGTVTPLEFRLPGTVERLKKLLETAPDEEPQAQEPEVQKPKARESRKVEKKPTRKPKRPRGK